MATGALPDFDRLGLMEALRRSEERFRLLVDGVIGHAIFMLDLEGVVETWNAGAERLKGWTESEIVGSHFSVFYTEEDRAAGLPTLLLERARREGHVEHSGWRVRKDGSRFWADVVITALRDPEGEIIGFAKVTRDMTANHADLEALRRSEERFRLLVGAVEEYAIFMLDASGIIASWNTGAERLKGWTEKEILGNHFSIFYPEEDRAVGLPARLLERARREGQVEHRGWRVRKDSSRFWADVVITALRGPDGDVVGFAKVTRDMTQAHEAELVRERALQEQLQAARRLATIDQWRRDFINSVVHDLATPVAAVEGFAVILRDRVADEDLQLLDHILGNARKLQAMIEHLRTYAMLEEGRTSIERRPVDLRSLAEDVVSQLEPVLAGHPVDIEIPDLEVSADVQGLERILQNLLTNAARYSAPGAPIRLIGMNEGDRVVIGVQDAGVGIPEERRQRIFDRFEGGGQPGGMGLGLSIVKQYVDLHGGVVWVDSQEGRGSTFWFSLPRR